MYNSSKWSAQCRSLAAGGTGIRGESANQWLSAEAAEAVDAKEEDLNRRVEAL
jgi:hypothetical protein